MAEHPALRAIRVAPISESAFAPFGSLVRHVEGVPIADASNAFAGAHPRANRPVLEWVRLAEGVQLPLAIERLEQHPFSAQTFLPHSGCPFLVVVCPALANGLPDALGLQAFEVPGHLGVNYAAGVWHHSLLPLQGLSVFGPSVFVMAMMRTGNNDDTVFHPFAATVER
jgi:ureidoglycolate lyase